MLSLHLAETWCETNEESLRNLPVMLNHLVFNGKVRNNEQNNSFYPRAGKRFATETLKIWNPLPARIANNSDGPPVR